MDAITLLRADHKTSEANFKRFEKLGDRAYVAKSRVTRRIVEELSVHAAIEEQVFYPAVRREVAGTDDQVLEALEEHHVVKWLLSELEHADPQAERFDAKVTVLIEMVRHHVEEEETALFPRVRAALGRTRLGQIGEQLEAARSAAPTRPHPRAPETPPGNVLVGLPSAMVDRITTAGRRAVGKAR